MLDQNDLELICAIIESARKDVLTKKEDDPDYQDAIEFFQSEWYTQLTNGRDGEQDLKKILNMKENK